MDATDHGLEKIRPQDTVLGSRLGPVVVDKATSTVRLIHYTLQEYFSWPGILPDAHKTLAQSCLAYLNYDQLKRHPVNKVPDLGDMPLNILLCIGGHEKMELSDLAKMLALDFLGRYHNHISSILLCNKVLRIHLS